MTREHTEADKQALLEYLIAVSDTTDPRDKDYNLVIDTAVETITRVWVGRKPPHTSPINWIRNKIRRIGN